MKKAFAIILFVFALAIAGQIATVIAAAPTPTALGGLGTSTLPLAGQIPIGENSTTYAPAYLHCTGNCSIATSSGGITLSVNGLSSLTAGTGITLTPNPITSTGTIANTGVLSLNGLSGNLLYNVATGTPTQCALFSGTYTLDSVSGCYFDTVNNVLQINGSGASTGGLSIGTSTENGELFVVGSTSLMGNVGIGISTPAAKVDIAYDATSTASTTPILQLGTTPLSAPSANGTYLAINSPSTFTGNLLEIEGSSSPLATLDYRGNFTVPNSVLTYSMYTDIIADNVYGSTNNIAIGLNDGGAGIKWYTPNWTTIENTNYNLAGYNFAYTGGNVGIGTTSTPASLTIASASSTVRIGAGGVNPGCIELYDAVNSSTLMYVYSSSGTLIDTSTKPAFCE